MLYKVMTKKLVGDEKGQVKELHTIDVVTEWKDMEKKSVQKFQIQSVSGKLSDNFLR